MREEDSDSYVSTVESMPELNLKEEPDLKVNENAELDLQDHSKFVTDIHYNNPKADLSLIAADGTCFQVDAWTMSKKSKFIKTQMTFLQDRSMAYGCRIELDFSSEVVRMFIDGMYSRHDYWIDMTVPQFRDLFGLCDYFQAPRQDGATARALKERFVRPVEAPLDPWDVFKLAAQRDNIEIAKLAASKLQEDNRSLTQLLFATPLSTFDGVPPRYVYALARSSIWHHDRVKLPWGGTGGAWMQRGPTDIAENFKLD